MTAPTPILTRRFELEALEPRVLLSADGLSSLAGPAPIEQNPAIPSAEMVLEEGGDFSKLRDSETTLSYNPQAAVDDLFYGVAEDVAESHDVSSEEAATVGLRTVVSGGDKLDAEVSSDPSASDLASNDFTNPTAKELTETLRAANGPPAETAVDSSETDRKTTDYSLQDVGGSGGGSSSEFLLAAPPADLSISLSENDAEHVVFAALAESELLFSPGVEGASAANQPVNGTDKADTITISGGEVEVTTPNGPSTITAFQSNQNVTVDGKGENDTIKILKVPDATSLTLNGGAGEDTASFEKLNNDLTIMLGFGGAARVIITTSGGGTKEILTQNVEVIDGKEGRENTLDLSGYAVDLKIAISREGEVVVKKADNTELITVTHVSNIIGGKKNDTFLFLEKAELTGWIDGGLGENTLDYTQYGEPVAVDLSDNLAQSGYFKSDLPKKGVKNIWHIAGGDGKDQLTGDASDNHLTGGDGDDVLIGGQGADTLTGGEGSDTYKFLTPPNPASADPQDTIVEEPGSKDGNTLDFSLYNPSNSETMTFVVGLAVEVRVSKLGKPNDFFALLTQPASDISKILASPWLNNIAGDQVVAWREALTVEKFGLVTLDMSSITDDLVFEIGKSSEVTVIRETGGIKARLIVKGVEKLIGGKGNNTYRFESGGELLGDLIGGPADQPVGKLNVLDYSAYDDPVEVNLTDQKVEFGSALPIDSVKKVMTADVPSLPVQERWTITMNGLKGSLFSAKFREESAVPTEDELIERLQDEQHVRDALAVVLGRSDFVVKKTQDRAKVETTWTVLFSEPESVDDLDLNSNVRSDVFDSQRSAIESAGDTNWVEIGAEDDAKTIKSKIKETFPFLSNVEVTGKGTLNNPWTVDYMSSAPLTDDQRFNSWDQRIAVGNRSNTGGTYRQNVSKVDTFKADEFALAFGRGTTAVQVKRGSYELTTNELLDLNSLATRLYGKSDALSSFLWSDLPKSTQDQVTEFVVSQTGRDQLANALVQELNRLIQGPSIYEINRFSGVTLSPKAQTLRDRNPTGADLVQLNRMLLQEAYSQEIWRAVIGIGEGASNASFDV